MSYKRKMRTEDKGDFYSGLVNTWVMATFIILPLIFTNYYFNILVTKTITFTILSIIMLFPALINALAEGDLRKIFGKENFSFKRENIANIAFLVFTIAAIISTLSAYPFIFQAYQGNEGRYNGLQLYLIYFLLFIFVSRYFKFDMKIFDAFIIVSILVALFGISDYFNLNLLGFKTNMKPEQWAIFTSTFGNINTYTAFIALFLGLSMCMYIFSDNEGKDGISIRKTIFYYVSMLIAFMALTMGNSDNGYLTLATLFGFIPFVAFKKKESLLRYTVSFTSYLTIIQIIALINELLPQKVVGINGIYNILAEFKYLYVIIICAWLLTILIYILTIKTNTFDKISNILRIMWSLILLGVIATVIYLIYKVNSGEDLTKYGALSQYLIFNNEWGTYRGYIWRATIEEFSKLNIIHKLFGTGPDTFGIYMYRLRYDDMLSKTNQYFDSAHNEYLQYLFTHGIIGLISYIVLLVAVISRGFRAGINMVKDNKKSSVLLGLSFSVFSYAIQAIVNINIPIAAVFFFMFIMLTYALSKE